MDFSTFSKILRPIIGGNSVEDFVYELFNNITEFPEDETEDNAVLKAANPTLKSYYLGERQITNFSKKISQYVEPALFSSYLYEKSPEAQQRIYEAFKPYCQMADERDMCDAVAKLFADIIFEAAKAKRKRKIQTEVDASDESSLSDSDLLLLSSSGKCPLCNCELIKNVKGRAKGQYKAVQIFPDSLDLFSQEKFSAVYPPPENLNSIANRIMLCTSCAESYEFEPTIGEYTRLVEAKQNMARDSAIENITKEVGIEDGVNDILTKLSNLTECPEGASDIRWEGFCVEQKIPGNYRLQNTVVHWVLTNYRYIENEFKIAARNKSVNYKKVRAEISLCFESLYEQDLSQQEIFDRMAYWISEQTGHKNIMDCQIVVAFFIQNCEVFYDTSE